MIINPIKILLFTVIAFVSINIFIIPNMWDGLPFSHAFKINDLEYLNVNFCYLSTLLLNLSYLLRYHH